MMTASIAPADEPFREALTALVRETEWVTSSGNPSWHAFARELEGVHYETLRKALAGERAPSPLLMEECARALRVKPEHFVEYRLHAIQRKFDVREVGFEKALSNLAEWSREQKTRGT